MEIFELTVPGHWIDGLTIEQKRPLMALIRLLEDRLMDGTLALALYERSLPLLEDMSLHGAPFDGIPFEVACKLPFLHANTMMFALDGISKALDAMASTSNVPREVPAIAQDFKDAFPGLKQVRDSAHHLEDRMRRQDRKGARFTPKAIRTPGFYSVEGGLFVRNLDGNSLLFTGQDGGHYSVAITAESLRIGQSAIQRVIDTFEWSGPTRKVPDIR